MQIPPYWVRGTYSAFDREGRELNCWAYGWSFTSEDEAHALAVERARRALERRSDARRAHDYDYSTPLREEIVDTLSIDDQPLALVTRNRYGALVLNTARVMFVDIDLETRSAAPSDLGFFARLKWAFSPAYRRARQAAGDRACRDEILAWLAADRRRAGRLYRTHSGYRLLLTDRLYQPREPDVAEIFNALRCDRLYRRLTERQECFRARLTPKPWRCGLERPPSIFPYVNAAAEQRQQQWLRRYEQASRAYRTCELLEAVGPAPDDDEIARIVELHDAFVLGAPPQPLA